MQSEDFIFLFGPTDHGVLLSIMEAQCGFHMGPMWTLDFLHGDTHALPSTLTPVTHLYMRMENCNLRINLMKFSNSRK